ncbi:MAG TPA: hypothetical protein VG795_00665 [Acidimicrobiia bacterium]|nr:hypothetical protein [Acidimicrobiia bacterium]
MKRFIIATASALFLLASSAAASVPNGPATRVARDYSFSSSAIGGPGVGTVVPDGITPLVPGVDPALPDPDLALPDLPGSVSQLLSTVDPALANLVEASPAPAEGSLSPVIAAPSAVEPPAPVPGLTEPSKPAEPKKIAAGPAKKQARGITRKASLRTAAAATDIFKGLPADGHAAYGTASVIHAHALQVGDQRLENTDAAFSGATFSSAQISEIKNEMARIVAPALAARNAFGRGSGLEVGLAIGQSDPNQIIPGSVAEAKAPPSTELVTKEVGPVSVPPVVSASLLRGQAQSKANTACTTGTDLSYGLGYAADLGLVNSAVRSAAATPDRAVSQSRSHTFLVAQEGAPTPIRKFGLASETRQTIAPVTLFGGSANEITLEFAGEWVLRTVADGNVGKVFYGPGNVSPNTPILRILRPSQPVQEILSTQQLFGPGGLTIDVSPLLKVSIGAPPRMIGGADNSKPVETATFAAAAVDVVRVTLLSAEGSLTAADVRIGHMENATAVPAGGIECGIQMKKVSDKPTVGRGETFTWTITVTNPNDCFLTKLKVVDTITADPGVTWTVDSASPTADEKSNTGVTWNDLGTLSPGQSKDVTITLTVGPTSGAGRFLDKAVATGVCGPAAGTAGADAAVGVPLESSVELNAPEVIAALGSLLPRELPRTGGLLALLPALALTGGGMLLRASKRRRQQ